MSTSTERALMSSSASPYVTATPAAAAMPTKNGERRFIGRPSRPSPAGLLGDRGRRLNRPLHMVGWRPGSRIPDAVIRALLPQRAVAGDGRSPSPPPLIGSPGAPGVPVRGTSTPPRFTSPILPKALPGWPEAGRGGRAVGLYAAPPRTFHAWPARAVAAGREK